MPTPFTRDQLSPDMQARYGLDKRPVGRWIGTTIVILGFVGVLVFVTYGLTRNPVDARLISWDDVAADRVNISFQVKRPADAEVTCVLRAQDTKRIDVGYATVVVPPGEAEVTVDYALRTIAPANTAELLGCGTNGPPSVPPAQFPPGVVPPEQPYS